MDINTDGRDIDFDAVVADLRKRGFEAYVEQTGGGVATIMVGKQVPVQLPSIVPSEHMVVEDRYELLVGPGTFDGPNWTLPRGTTLDLYIGPDDDGLTDAVTVGASWTEETVVNEVVVQLLIQRRGREVN